MKISIDDTLLQLNFDGTNITNDSNPSSIPGVNESIDVPPDRMIDAILAGILSLINLYLFTVSSLYYVRHSHESIKPTNRIICVCAFLLLLESCWFQSEISLKSNVTDAFCRAYTIVNLFLSIGNKTLVYTLLWIRQRSFYKTCTFVGVNEKKFDHLSRSLLAGILLFACLQIIVLAALPMYKGRFGCNSGSPSSLLQVITPVLFVIVCLFQLLLLGPVLYPILQHIRGRREAKGVDRLEKMFLRLSLCTAVCIITDILFIGVSIQRPGPYYSYSFIPICYSVNMVINVTAILVSYSDYKLRLFPFRRKKKQTVIFKNVVYPLPKTSKLTVVA